MKSSLSYNEWKFDWMTRREAWRTNKQTNKNDFFEQNHSALIQCEVQHKKIVQNNEVVTFSQWMVIRLNDEEGGMNVHQTNKQTIEETKLCLLEQ